MQINCSNPEIILNPLLPELVAMNGNITIRGIETKFYHSKRLLYEFKRNDFQPHHLGITLDDFDSCYVRDYNTRETYPVYIQVPCGHCEICRQARVNAFVDRCKLETQMYKCKPLFITLTYDELHRKESGVCVRDIQLFFKRLRINLFRQGYREKIKYAVCAEYGRRTSRPHYHGILWNVHQTNLLSYFQIRDIIQKSWSNGFVMCRLVDPSDDKAFYYTSKYLYKDSNIPEGCNKTFMVCSNRGGSIGATFIDRLRKHATRYLNTELKYVNRWNGHVNNVLVNRYMLNRLVPSLSRSLPYSLKCRVRRFVYDFNILRSRHDYNYFLFVPQLERYVDFFGKFFYIYNPSEDFRCHELDYSRSTNSILREMLQDEVYIERAYSKGDDFFFDCVRLDSIRQKYLLKLFAHATDQDLNYKTRKIIRFNAMAAQREIF